MEFASSIWLIGTIALVAGASIGALVYRQLSTAVNHIDEVQSELDAARKSLEDYKTSVNDHFCKTSELVNDLTQNYVKVYQHLAEGAQSLGDSRALNNLLEQHQGKVVLAVKESSEIREPVAEVAAVELDAMPEAPDEPISETEVVVAEPDVSETVSDEHERESIAAEAPPSAKPALGSSDAGEQPVLDVDKFDLDRKAESASTTELENMVAKPTEGIEIPTTRH
jgi:uncharacterized membrane-anchored protein YhcB (DUF1043 family)